eukprot:968703-Rhodomonas_salina.1
MSKGTPALDTPWLASSTDPSLRRPSVEIPATHARRHSLQLPTPPLARTALPALVPAPPRKRTVCIRP